jgi:FMN-dependent oxidoreductase (nitrilotriacetate monooxygenase family)
MAAPKQMHLAAYYNPTGHHVASWRHPRAQVDAHINIRHYVEIARTAERAKFDLLFLADASATREAAMAALCRSVQFIAHFEPLTLLSALAMVTDRIGLVATASTSWMPPYQIARQFASLDHISAGRAGWNAVTSVYDDEARNFGHEQAYDHADRYDRAHEVIDIVLGLWDSWDDDAFVRDRESGLFFDPEKMHVLNHRSERYRVKGPLNVPRTPQGRPVVVQAGASDAGMELAARYAEAVFTPHLTSEAAKLYHDTVKARMLHHNRDPDHLKILPGLSVIVRPSAAEAEADYQYLQSLIHPVVGREILSTMLGGIDLSPYPLDGPLPDPLPLQQASKGHFDSILAMAKRENLTIRQLGERVSGARGKNVIKGSPREVADYMEDWFAQGACDGFTIMPPYIPGALDDFCDLVIPELQRRGLFRTEYEGATLRDHLGLARPESRYARTAAMAI